MSAWPQLGGNLPGTTLPEVHALTNEREVMLSIALERLPEVMKLGATSVRTTECLRPFSIYVTDDERGRFIAFNPGTWSTLCYDLVAQSLLLERLTSGALGMRTISLNNEHYAAALRKQFSVTGNAALVSPLVVLAKDAQKLLVAAAGMSATRDPRQHQLFREMYDEILVRLQEVEYDVARIRASVELAEVAIAEAM